MNATFASSICHEALTDGSLLEWGAGAVNDIAVDDRESVLLVLVHEGPLGADLGHGLALLNLFGANLELLRVNLGIGLPKNGHAKGKFLFVGFLGAVVVAGGSGTRFLVFSTTASPSGFDVASEKHGSE